MAVAAGWYQDPDDGSRQRWWDGSAWTIHIHAVPGASSAEVQVPPPLVTQVADSATSGGVPHETVRQLATSSRRISRLFKAGAVVVIAVLCLVVVALAVPTTSTDEERDESELVGESVPEEPVVSDLRVEPVDTRDDNGRLVFETSLSYSVAVVDADCMGLPDHLSALRVMVRNSAGQQIGVHEVGRPFDQALGLVGSGEHEGMCVTSFVVPAFVDQLTNDLTVIVGLEVYPVTVEQFLSGQGGGLGHVLWPSQTPGVDPVANKIVVDDNCVHLQETFDRAAEAADRYLGDDLFDLYSDRMKLADQRMQEVGCYAG